MPSRMGFTATERALYSTLRRLLSQPGLLRGGLRQNLWVRVG